jgi:fatty-acyl-CoA synthase
MKPQLETSYFKGVETPELLDQTIGDLFDRVASRFPGRDALVACHQAIRWSYAEYRAEIEKLATGLLALGIEPGDRVGIWAPNCYEWCLTQFATAKIGAIMVCFNPAYRDFELEFALNKSGCRAIVTAEQFKSSRYLELLQKLAPELNSCAPGRLQSRKLPALEVVIRMGAGSTPGMYNFGAVCRMGGEA